ncbi:MAG: type II toxin-antitoxin system VapC family toxin [Nitrososphaerales archaeon]
MIYVDSNYWIYWLDSRLPEHDHVMKTMRGAIREGVAMNYVTLLEIAHYLRFLPKKEFVELTGAVLNLSTLTLFDLDARVADLALGMAPEYAGEGLGSRDCAILATMKLSGVRKIATHDRSFEAVEGIEVVDAIPRKGN